MNRVKIVGAGLAGVEAAYQLAKRGIQVDLYEMRPTKSTLAHKTEYFAELVCSNSLRSNQLTNAVGILKEEMRMLDSIIMKAADACSVPSGSSLSVDREGFAKMVTQLIKEHPNIRVIHQEVTEIFDGPTIIASGPLTSDTLSEKIKDLVQQESLYFYDAAAPIIEKSSINMDIAYYKSRYDHENKGDYINCPMNQEQFFAFYQELIKAQTIQLKEFEKEIYFEGCMPFEEIARRGYKTLLFGPMKPVGLEKTKEDKRPYAVVQLRQDDAIASLYNVVGFQTHLTFKEQKRILQMIPGLENCNIVRYGVMHRNTYLNAPKVLKATYQFIQRDDLFFAGQMTGVEGYIESAASGLLAGINMARFLLKKELIHLPSTCMMGAMANYITTASKSNFQPMNANFGIFALVDSYEKHNKKDAYWPQASRVIKEYFYEEL
ncbi:MAG: methylenetetrahydrofolate--tRNA-(uracil(54)-C(5))-methyltransferase (FADH(2)-oxidizing) TrmFO [Erysipelotrichaceae bacterium]|nr:methylenetetrahydrofolate--tRNA-(uracil(54)-C(5))-methyltransferase (FADH(2)-oxidizing) TrmFO [Erysipelotrichaceae bacterium]